MSYGEQSPLRGGGPRRSICNRRARAPSPFPKGSKQSTYEGESTGEFLTEIRVAVCHGHNQWRIRHGLARFPVDLDPDSLPAEAGLDVEPLIDRTKGCYLGQESVARVRNLGHPPRVVLGVRAESSLRPGAPVRSNGADVGLVTSVEPRAGLAGIVRIRWDARDRELSADGGIPLERRGTPIGGPPILRAT